MKKSFQNLNQEFLKQNILLKIDISRRFYIISCILQYFFLKKNIFFHVVLVYRLN